VRERAETTFEQWMQIKDSLLATVSHEMRSPLHGIIASLELLNSRETEMAEDTREELLQNVTHCASVLHLLINNVLLSGGGPRDKNTLVAVRMPLSALVSKMEAVGKALAMGRTLQLNVRCDEDHKDQVVLLTDELALVQVGLNYVSNAVRHAVSRVDVALRLEQGSLLVLRVQDDGPGVPASKRSHLFSGQPRKAGLKVGVSFFFALGRPTYPVVVHAGEWCWPRTGHLQAHGCFAWWISVVRGCRSRLRIGVLPFCVSGPAS
jgi:K+-sensing histidine kinase KdpD